MKRVAIFLNNKKNDKSFIKEIRKTLRECLINQFNDLKWLNNLIYINFKFFSKYNFKFK